MCVQEIWRPACGCCPSEHRLTFFTRCVLTTPNAFVISLGSSCSSQTFSPLQEKGNTPLHVAARAGQVSQAELLTVYGADPGAPDSSGKTPIDYARSVFHIDAFFFFYQSKSDELQTSEMWYLAFYVLCREAGHHELADRLVEVQYELTDRLAFYLCGRRPGQ